MTFTGGEPFLRADLDDLVISAYRHCRPEVITIPTNGMLTERVLAKVERMCRECPKSSIGINLSLDGIGEEHDDIRGVEGNWKLSMETWRQLKALQKQYPNLVLTVHTVISRFNVHRFQADPGRPAVPRARQLHHRGGRGARRAGHRGLGHYAAARGLRRDRRLPQPAGEAGAGQGHRPLHAGLSRPVLSTGQARAARARAGHPLLCRLGQRPHRAQRRPVELLHPRRIGRQPAQSQLRPGADCGAARPWRNCAAASSARNAPAPWPTPTTPTCCSTRPQWQRSCWTW